ncbi:MAG: DUF4394 domain-containing protein [Candidatus Binatia bacterium]
MRSKWQRILVTTAIGIGLSAQLAAAREPGCGGRSHDFKSNARLRMVGLTDDQRLVHFRECNPARTKSAGAVSGLIGDTALIGIDFRVQNGKLYGVGDTGGVYIVDPETAVATLDSQLTVALSGTTFGVDFNPAADRLRVISDTGQNLRHDLNTDTTTLDTGLAYVPAAVATIAAGAYTNNDLDPTTATTLFDVDTNLDQIAVQSPANSGTLAPSGKLTLDVDAGAGFDITTSLRGGVAVGNRGFATLAAAGIPGLYRVNLLTGKATLIGKFDTTVVDLAIPLDQ